MNLDGIQDGGLKWIHVPDKKANRKLNRYSISRQLWLVRIEIFSVLDLSPLRKMNMAQEKAKSLERKLDTHIMKAISSRSKFYR